MFAMHAPEHSQFYGQTGPEPPGAMTAPVFGKLMEADGEVIDCRGMLTIDEWITASRSPNPDLYPSTGVLHPAHWRFAFDDAVPADIRDVTMTPLVPDQTNFFGNGAEYREGAVVLRDPAGNDVGRGFAEAVNYADPIALRLSLAGLPADLLPIVQPHEASLPRRLWSLAYVATHQNELKSVMASAPGAEFYATAES
jgi:hypothetical protein